MFVHTIDICTISYRFGPVAGLVACHAVLVPGLYHAEEITVLAHTTEGCKGEVVRWAAELRNDVPRLVSITVIAGLDREAVAS